MPQYIAFLRGINVGGHRVKMDRLRGLFEELGLTDVSTFIASGNVIFSADSRDVESLKDDIERHLAQGLGYDVSTFLRTPAQLEAIVSFETPAVEPTGQSTSSVYVILMDAPATDEMRSTLTSLGSEVDEFRFSGAEVYWRVQGKLRESPLFGGGLERALRGTSTTTRNMNTLRRIVSKTRKGGEKA